MRKVTQLLIRIVPLVLLVNGVPALASVAFAQINTIELRPKPIFPAKPELSASLHHKQFSRTEENANEPPQAGLSERADLLLQQGVEQLEISQYPEALDSFETALEIYRELDDRASKAIILNNIGNIYRFQGSYADALSYYQQSRLISLELGDQTGEAGVLNNIGVISQLQGSYADALDYYQQSFVLSRELGDRSIEALTLSNIGNIYQLRGSYADALDYSQQSLVLSRELGDRATEALTLSNIGHAYQLQGSYADAIDYYQQSLVLSRELGNRATEALTLGNIGHVYKLQGSYVEALDYSQQSLVLSRELGDRATEALSLNNIGLIYQSQGDYADAIHYYKQSLVLSRELGNRVGEGITLGNIGVIFQLQGSYAHALDYYQQSLVLSLKLGNRAAEAATLGNIGNIFKLLGSYADAIDYSQQSLVLARELGNRVTEALTLNNIGLIYRLQGSYADALDYYQQSLVLSRELGDRANEAIALNNIGETYSLQGSYADALSYYQQSLVLSRELGDRPVAAKTLSNIAKLFETQKQSALAITFLKQAVSTYESIRDGNRELSQNLQESYTTTIEKDYRRLADLLLQQNRILEAQQVLDLLKVQELDDYLRGVRGPGETLSILRPEQAILEKYNEQTATAIELGQELETLRNLEGELTPAQEQRRLDLVELQEDINQQFKNFATSDDVRTLLAQLAPAVQDATVRLTSLNRLQRELPDLNATLIYPLILPDRLEIVVMLPGSPPLRRTVEGLDQTDLNQTILDLRQALDNPNNNPLPAAQQLYTWLIEPIEADLTQAGVDSLIYAPDGQLRYVPLAALHDGESWLIERYGINNITAESLTEFDDAPNATPRVLAGAFTDTAITYPIEIDGNTVSFSGLPFAGTELDNLEATQPGMKPLRDRDFTLNAVKGIMNEYEILHFATHAAFVNSNPEDSFILFGNGDRPNLLDIGNWTLSNVDLVVLSACETGLDGFGNGAEILGMGYQFQLAGAGAVMASLWSVSDRGTQDLMGHFYKHLGNNQPKAKALQQAQIDLINGNSTLGADDPRGGLAPAGQTTTLPENLQGLRHPHYWAPFILIGNGL